jgi:hypothetical protein
VRTLVLVDRSVVSTYGVLIAALALLALVLFWSSRYGGRGRGTGTSLRRGPSAHTTIRGQPKRGYAQRDEAEAHARMLMKRDGAPMNVYRCSTCAKWHVGHEK